MLSVVFSTTAHAETVSHLSNIVVYGTVSGTNYTADKTFTFTSGDNTSDTGKFISIAPIGGSYTSVYNYTFTSADGIPLVKADSQAKVTIDKWYTTFAIENSEGAGLWYADGYGKSRLLLTYEDGTQEYYDDYVITGNGERLKKLTFTITPDKDIMAFDLNIQTSEIGVNVDCTIHQYYGHNFGSTFAVIVEQDSKTEGLLGGILQWIKDLYNKVVNGFADMLDSLAELPRKIWSFIEEGLKKLFVPSEQYITEFKANMENMLSQKLGAVYQVLDITFDSWDRISANDIANTIELPKSTINVSGNNTFSFGGYDVVIVPDGFEWLATMIKTIVGIVTTILFVNGLRKRYDEVMGVEQ